MYKIVSTKRFEKELHDFIKNGFDVELFKSAVPLFIEHGKLPNEFQTHKLARKPFVGYYDSHLDDDTVIIYMIKGKIVVLIRIGTHSDLF